MQAQMMLAFFAVFQLQVVQSHFLPRVKKDSSILLPTELKEGGSAPLIGVGNCCKEGCIAEIVKRMPKLEKAIDDGQLALNFLRESNFLPDAACNVGTMINVSSSQLANIRQNTPALPQTFVPEGFTREQMKNSLRFGFNRCCICAKEMQNDLGDAKAAAESTIANVAGAQIFPHFWFLMWAFGIDDKMKDEKKQEEYGKQRKELLDNLIKGFEGTTEAYWETVLKQGESNFSLLQNGRRNINDFEKLKPEDFAERCERET